MCDKPTSRLIVQVGSLLYARVSLAHKDMEPELECFDAQTRKAEGFGELKGGFVVHCSLKMCRMYAALVACFSGFNELIYVLGYSTQNTSSFHLLGRAFRWRQQPGSMGEYGSMQRIPGISYLSLGVSKLSTPTEAAWGRLTSRSFLAQWISDLLGTNSRLLRAMISV